jgi:4-hydroxyproline epimerase
MCGHGMIGLITTLAWQGRIGVGTHGVETPVGTVTATLSADGRVAVRNVRSYRVAKGVPVSIPSERTEHAVVMHGDLAWGGNWFFLVSDHGVPVLEEHCTRLTEVALRVRTAAHAAGYPEVDHVELLGPPGSSENDGRSFVLCPSGTYDRSPCGTGTSAKLACLAADGALAPGAIWRQEGILGTVFEGCFEWATAGDPAQGIIPTIRARAWVTGAGELVFRGDDPLRNGRAG